MTVDIGAPFEYEWAERHASALAIRSYRKIGPGCEIVQATFYSGSRESICFVQDLFGKRLTAYSAEWRKVMPGTYAIRDARGEIYLCPPEIFIKTYEPVRIEVRTTYRPVQAEQECTEYRLVPVKPTPEMIEALRTGSQRDCPSDELCAVRYAAMLAAAPQPDRSPDNH